MSTECIYILQKSGLYSEAEQVKSSTKAVPVLKFALNISAKQH